MARVVGLDIGTFSVRVAVLEVGIRTWEVLETAEEPIVYPPAAPAAAPDDDADTGEFAATDAADAAPEPALEESLPTLGQPVLDALTRLHERGIFEGDAVYASMSPDEVLLTRISLPFSSDKEIAPVLAPQLEGRIPADVDDLLIDFMRGGRLENREYAVFVAGIDPAQLALLLAELNGVGIDPKTLDIPPFQQVTAARAMLPPLTGPVAVVDIGANMTGVAVLDAENVQLARSFRGGGEKITEALADMFELDLDTARAGKHREGFIDGDAPETDTTTGQDSVDIANACRRAVKPLIRQLRRTLHAHATEWGTGVEHVYLTGGTASLPGMVEYVGQSLGLPASVLAPPASNVPATVENPQHFTTAIGLALRGSTAIKGSTMDARVGPFAFKGTYEYLRQRIPELLIGAGILALLCALFVLGRFAVANAELKALDETLTTATQSVFGEEITEPDTIRSRLLMGSARISYLPEVSAYALFVTATNTVGATLDLGYDVAATDIEIDMERRIFRMQGTADSAESVDTFEAQLAQQDCFKSIERNDLSQASRGEGFEFSVQGVIDCGEGSDEEEES